MDENDENPYIEEGGKGEQSYVEALDYYFKIKNDYERKLREAKHKIYQKENNKKITKKKILELNIPCIHCKRPVGTIFSNTKYNLIAICGDKQNPCILNIEIFKGFMTNINYLLNLYKEDIDFLKDSIIKQKLDTLFDYINEAQTAQTFKKGLDAYNGDSVIYKEVLEKYNSLYENQYKMDLIADKNGQIFRLIEKSRGFLDEYKKTQNPEFLKMAIELNIKEIVPEIQNLRTLKNEVMEVNVETDKDENQKIFTLFTYPVLLSKIDYNNGEPQRVVKFVT
jgi:hypothetical protein